MKKVILAALAFAPALALATPGAYVQLQAGGNLTDANSSFNNSSFSGFAGGANIGYLWGDSSYNYGLEITGLFYPDSTTSNNGVNLKINGYNTGILGVLKYTDCTSGFSLFGKVGAVYVSQKVSGTGAANFSTTNNQVAPEGDLGVGYQFNPNWELDLTGNYVWTNNTTANNNANLLLGLTYRFV